MATFARVELYPYFRIQTGHRHITTPVVEDIPVYTAYTEEGLHRPFLREPVDEYSTPSVPQAEDRLVFFENVTPRKGNEFSVMELPVEWSKYFASVLSVDEVPHCIFIYPDSSSRNYIVGWIDAAEPVATKGPSVNTRISWHIDYYLTGEYFRFEYYRRNHGGSTTGSKQLYGVAKGRVKRSPEKDDARPDPSTPRKWVYDSKFAIRRQRVDPDDPDEWVYDENGPYCIVIYTESVGSPPNQFTRIRTAYWGMEQAQIAQQYAKIDFQRIYSGKLEECMGIAPSSIVGVFFSPLPPYPIESAEAMGFVAHNNFDGSEWGWYDYESGKVTPTSFDIVFDDPIETNDLEKWLLVDPMGTVYGTLPWGMQTTQLYAVVNVGTQGCWLEIEFKNGNAMTPEWGEGRRVQIPLIAAPVTSNDLSDYVLSGQQEYDRSMAAIQQEQNLKSGVAGIGTSVVGGAVAGGMMGSGPGAIAGGIIGGVSSIIGNYMNTEIQKETDAKSFAAMDKLLSNQISNVIISGGGSNWYWNYGGQWLLVKMKRDDYSYVELEEEQKEKGYVTDYWIKDCSYILHNMRQDGGGIRVEGLEVTGPISNEGKRYIEALFERGVHFDVYTIYNQ